MALSYFAAIAQRVSGRAHEVAPPRAGVDGAEAPPPGRAIPKEPALNDAAPAPSATREVRETPQPPSTSPMASTLLPPAPGESVASGEPRAVVAAPTLRARQSASPALAVAQSAEARSAPAVEMHHEHGQRAGAIDAGTALASAAGRAPASVVSALQSAVEWVSGGPSFSARPPASATAETPHVPSHTPVPVPAAAKEVPPVEGGIHIGSIEVHVTPPAAPAPQPRRSDRSATDGGGRRLARGFVTGLGLRQS